MANITLIVGSTLGGAEYVADHLSDRLKRDDHHITLINQPNIEDLTSSSILLFITSTHGAGEFPDNIADFMLNIEEKAPDLSKLTFMVIGIGDSSYDTFCQAGIKAHSLLSSLNATAIASPLLIDILDDPLPEERAEQWLDQNMALFDHKK